MSENNSSEPQKIKILIADDHPLVRQALKGVLAEQPDFEIIGEVDNGEDAVKLSLEKTPDIVIMDISMPKLNGLEATRIIHARKSKIGILVLTIHDNDEQVIGIIQAGARGYLTKKVFGPEVVHAIRALAAGEVVFSDEVTDLFANIFKEKSSSKKETVCKLTPRELDILKLVARGYMNKEIGAKLGISPLSVKAYLGNLFEKCKVRTRTEAIAFSLRTGIITVNDLE